MVNPVNKHAVTFSTESYLEGLQPKHPNFNYPLSSKMTELTANLPKLPSSLQLIFLLLLPQAATACTSFSSLPSIFLVNNATAFKVTYNSKEVSVNQIAKASLGCNFTLVNGSIPGAFKKVKKCICSIVVDSWTEARASTIDLYSQNTTSIDNKCMTTKLYQQICPIVYNNDPIALAIVLSVFAAVVGAGLAYCYREKIKDKCCSRSSYRSF